jgi:hypothetical protein
LRRRCYETVKDIKDTSSVGHGEGRKETGGVGLSPNQKKGKEVVLQWSRFPQLFTAPE